MNGERSWARHSWDGLGLTYDNLRLVEPNPHWMQIAEDLKTWLVDTLDAHAVAIEHIGSAAVPGLVCKPIIDLALGVSSEADYSPTQSALTEEGWTYRGDAGDAGGHIFVFETSPSVRVAHAHVVPYGGKQWTRYLQFRELLKGDAAARAGYVEVKRALLAQHGSIGSRQAYTAGKTSIVTSLLGDS